MSYNYVTVSGSFPTLTGTVTFTPPAEVTDLTGTIPVQGPGPFPCTVAGGSFASVPLLATDNHGLLPAGWTYNATVALTGQRAYTYPVLIPAAGGSTAVLSALPVSAAGGGGSFGDVTSVTAGDASVTVGGTPAAPTVETGTLDVIASLHAPVASVGMNSQKITAVAGGSASTDVATVGQLGGVGYNINIPLWMPPRTDTGTWTTQQLSNMYGTYNSSAALNDAISFNFYIPTAGTYALAFLNNKSTDSAIASLSFDGGTVSTTADLYAASLTISYAITIGLSLSAGAHYVTFAALAKNVSSTAYIMRLGILDIQRTA